MKQKMKKEIILGSIIAVCIFLTMPSITATESSVKINQLSSNIETEQNSIEPTTENDNIFSVRDFFMQLYYWLDARYDVLRERAEYWYELGGEADFLWGIWEHPIYQDPLILLFS